ncbi:MAG: oligosaccharyl transferase, archaeosortase A system-associated [Methanoregula sp.]|nr:oligosaccharyl transferase, archaeosortase A system-associated [Methanoregula sp.]
MDSLSGHSADDLLILNLVFLSVSTILLFVFGFKQPGVSLTQYSIGLVYVNGLLIAGTVLLYAFLRIFSGKRWLFLGSIAVLAVFGFVLIQSIPPLQTVISQGMELLFGSSTYAVSIVETLPWTLSGAWDQFNVALILMAGGLLILGYSVVKKRDDVSVFLLVWFVVMLLLTIQFQRFVYYFTVNVALLAAICVMESVRWREDWIVYRLSRVFPGRFLRSHAPVATRGDFTTTAPSKRDKKRALKRPPGVPVHYTDTLKDLIVIIVVLLTIILCAISLTQDITYGMSTPRHQLSPDWMESLEWLGNHTPDTGVNYFQQYEARGFSYPPQAYGIMASWDAGHWITFIAQRIPITNPFQDHLAGPSGAAAFFLNGNESQADAILAKNGGRYVITDSTMAVDRFTNLVPWESGSTDISPYIKWFVVPDQNNPSHLQKIHLFDDTYFQTLVVRLQNFDGSMTRPTTVEYVQYVIRYVPAPGETAGDVNGYTRVIASDEEQDITRIPNDTVLVRAGKDITTGRFADLFSDLPNRTLQEIPALKHYRLIHESPNNASVQIFPESGITTLPDIKYVKIFEYVTGAHISGEGIIEVPIVTNTGRSFVYRQASDNGEFIVPYSTEGMSSGVYATGPYHIVGTLRNISVTEDDVMNGSRVSG